MNIQEKPQFLSTHFKNCKNFCNIHTVTTNMLVKYSPKYCKKLELGYTVASFGPILSKAKKIKKLEYIDAFYERNFILEILKDKRRHIKQLLPGLGDKFLKYFPNIPHFTVDIKLRTTMNQFINLKRVETLTLDINEDFIYKDSDKHSETFTKRCWKHFGALDSLQELNIIISCELGKDICDFFNKLDSYTHRLSSLKSLKLSLYLSIHSDLQPEKITLTNLLKYLTDFEVIYGTLYFQKYFSSTITHFSNVTHLVLALHNHRQLDFKNLHLIKDLQRLRLLTFESGLKKTESFKGFLDNITFPPSLQIINLELRDVNWNNIIPKILDYNFNLENPFEKDERCIEFYNKWSQFHAFQSLDLHFTVEKKCPISGIYFMFPILKRLSRLKDLTCSSTLDDQSKEQIKGIKLSRILNEVSHLSSNLNAIRIKDFRISLEDLSFDNLPSLELEELNIDSKIIGDTKVGILANLIKEGNEVFHKQYQVRLQRIIITNENTFATFLKNLKRYSTKLHINVNVAVDGGTLCLESANSILESFIRTQTRIPNLTLSIVDADTKMFKEKELLDLVDEYGTFRVLELVGPGLEEEDDDNDNNDDDDDDYSDDDENEDEDNEDDEENDEDEFDELYEFQSNY